MGKGEKPSEGVWGGEGSFKQPGSHQSFHELLEFKGHHSPEPSTSVGVSVGRWGYKVLRTHDTF